MGYRDNPYQAYFFQLLYGERRDEGGGAGYMSGALCKVTLQ